MAFTIVHGTPQMVWVPVSMGTAGTGAGETLYNGQLVRTNNEGAGVLAQPTGIGDLTHRSISGGVLAGGSSANNIVYGVVVGNNLKTPSFSSTVKADGVPYLAPASATSETYVGSEGPWAKGDKQAMVKVAILDPTCVLRGPLYNSTVGTALTTLTLTSSTTPTTLTCSTNTAQCTPVSNYATIYFRTGGQAGCYRITDSTSTTVHTWDLPLAAAPSVGDTAVLANLRPNGRSRMYIDSEAMFIDASAALTSNYFWIDVIRLDLSVSGNEYCDFRFGPEHFQGIDAS